MWLRIENLHARVVRATDAERAWLRAYLSFEDEEKKWAAIRRGVRPGQAAEEGKLRLFSLTDQTFPAGLLSVVLRAAEDEGIQVDLVDVRQRPCAEDRSADLSWLRDYQADAVRACIDKGRGIVWASTGSGKTEIAVALFKTLPCSWLFLVHRAGLMDQTIARAALRGIDPAEVGRVGDGSREWGRRISVGTFQAIHAMLRKRDSEAVKMLAEVQGIVCDEAHVIPADTFYKTVMLTGSAYFRIGLSGTPLARGDRRSIYAIAALEHVVYRIRSSTLIDAGVLAKPSIRLVRVPQKSERPTWQGVYGEAVVRSPARNAALVSCAQHAEKPCLLFVKEIKHGQILLNALQKAGIRAEFVWGNDSTNARAVAVKRLERGDVEVLICSVVFQEGIDIPALRSVVIGSGGKSVIAALQRIGRGMRRATGKDTFDVFDVADAGCGCPKVGGHSGCRWLERHSRARLRAYAGEGFTTVEVAPGPRS